MKGDEYGRRRLGLVNAKMTSHIVGMTSEGVEEESDEGKKRRLEKSQVAEEVRPVGPAVEPTEATEGMDQDESR